MLSPADAARQILKDLSPLSIETVPLSHAMDRVLAEDVTSPLDIPAWDNSAMDGWAVRSVDLATAAEAGPPTLRIVETIPAGAFPTKPLGPGECARIFTGAPIPEGCDGVIRQEDTTDLGDGRVRFDKTRDAGRNLRRRGEDIQRGAVVLTAGTPLGPAQLGVLASMVQGEVAAYRVPTVAFFGSGDEIAELDKRDEIIAGRKIASSNSYTLDAMIRKTDAIPINLGIAPDDPLEIRARFERAAAEADLIVTTAGISVGDHDYLRSVLDELGARLGFWRIRMRPGAPVGFGTVSGKPWIGLPGNPVSTMVTFELFVRPAIRKLLGHTLLFRRTVSVTMKERVTLGAPLTHFLRVVVREAGNGGLEARLTGPQGSGILTSMARANALLIVPAETREVAPGTMLPAILLDEPVHVEAPPF